jgi:hypothetical protein
MAEERFTVMVDDNFHYTDEDHRYKHGEFSTYADAVDACKKMLDEELADMLKQGIDPKDLSSQWAMFGSDPFIIGGSEIFSSRDYLAEKTK